MEFWGPATLLTKTLTQVLSCDIYKLFKNNPSKHSSWWRRLEDFLKTSFVFVFRRRLQDVLIKTNMFALALRLQDVSWSRPIYLSWPYVFKTSSRRLQDVFKTFSRHLQDVLKTSWRRLQRSSSPLQGVFKTSLRRPAKISSRRFQGVPSS